MKLGESSSKIEEGAEGPATGAGKDSVKDARGGKGMETVGNLGVCVFN